MKRKTAIFRGLAAVMAFLLFITVSGSNLMFTYAGVINSMLNVSTSQVITSGNASDLFYYDTRYGTDITNKQAALRLEMDAARENISQVEEGTVLLRNENAALPLAQGSRVTVFGNGIYNSLGTGNALGNSGNTSFEAIPPVTFCGALQDALGEDNVNLVLPREVYANLGSTSNVEIVEAPVEDVKAHESSWQGDYNDAALVMFSRTGSEGNDSAIMTAEGRHYLELSQNEEALMAYLRDQKAAGILGKIIALINTDQLMELDWLEQYSVDACLLVGSPGPVGFTGTANLLVGKVSPSGHLVDTYAANSLSAPSMTYAADNTPQFANADWVIANSADNNNNGINIINYLVYAEGIYVGYKYYETRYEDVVMGVGNAASAAGSSSGGWSYTDEVVYPFGYGLSYTTFDQELLDVAFDGSNDSYLVKVKATNTGSVAGKSVVEVYAQTPYGDYEKQNLVEKAAVNLVGFAKTSELAPGASETVTVEVPRYFLASYDANAAKGYILSAGDYYLSVGDNAHDALNNILAAKGFTTGNGMDYDGSAGKTYTWNQAELDTQSFRLSPYTGAEVTNAFDYASLGYYGVDFTYLSRSDWEGTYPAAQVAVSANEAMLQELSSNWYDPEADAPENLDVTLGANNGLTISDMRLVEWEDEETWNRFLDQLTVEEMASLMSDTRGGEAVESVNLPAFGRNDDGAGINAALVSTGTKPTNWCSEVMVARTWNAERFTAKGELLALEATFCNVNEIWYGGGNTHRTPVGGRIREYYSEDGNYSYIVGTYVAQAMQDMGVNYAVKHFALNDQETLRSGVSTFATEQSVREIYLRAFEGALGKGGALGVMTGFNRIGCRYNATNRDMLSRVLRGEWGYKGHVTTDGYTATSLYANHFEEEIVAGVNYCCVDGGAYGAGIKALVDSGDKTILAYMRQSAKCNLYAISRTMVQNGLSADSVVITIVPSWEIALVAAAGVFAVGLVGFTAAAALTGRGKEEKEA
ncbi:MAG: beta-glucosidase [Clostridiales bacterium]|nr:beta-glucosidase [Clostridiales bacterium]